MAYRGLARALLYRRSTSEARGVELSTDFTEL